MANPLCNNKMCGCELNIKLMFVELGNVKKALANWEKHIAKSDIKKIIRRNTIQIEISLDQRLECKAKEIRNKFYFI